MGGSCAAMSAVNAASSVMSRVTRRAPGSGACCARSTAMTSAPAATSASAIARPIPRGARHERR